VAECVFVCVVAAVGDPPGTHSGFDACLFVFVSVSIKV
jgi:hypothetical protein